MRRHAAGSRPPAQPTGTGPAAAAAWERRHRAALEREGTPRSDLPDLDHYRDPMPEAAALLLALRVTMGVLLGLATVQALRVLGAVLADDLVALQAEGWWKAVERATTVLLVLAIAAASMAIALLATWLARASANARALHLDAHSWWGPIESWVLRVLIAGIVIGLWAVVPSPDTLADLRTAAVAALGASLAGAAAAYVTVPFIAALTMLEHDRAAYAARVRRAQAVSSEHGGRSVDL